jgi:gluconate 2-dehydrogenase gamma chain
MSNPLHSDHISRRDFVGSVSVLGAVWLTAAACQREAAAPADSMSHGPAADAAAPPQQLVHFSADQAADIDAIASRIIPTTDTPGAHEAGVVYFIDRTMTTFAKDQAPMFDKALTDLKKSVQSQYGVSSSFTKLTPAQQDAQLKKIEDTPFFCQNTEATKISLDGTWSDETMSLNTSHHLVGTIVRRTSKLC